MTSGATPKVVLWPPHAHSTHVQPHSHTLAHTRTCSQKREHNKFIVITGVERAHLTGGMKKVPWQKKVASEVALHKGGSYLLTYRIWAGGAAVCAGGAKGNVTTRSPAVAKQAFVIFSFSTLPRWMVPRPDRFQPSLSPDR